MNAHLRTSLACLVASASFACPGLVQSGGFEVYKDTYDEGAHSVTAQAAFATSCPADQVQVVVLAVTPGDKSLPSSMGATACGKKLVYARVPGVGNWVLNSDSNRNDEGPKAK